MRSIEMVARIFSMTASLMRNDAPAALLRALDMRAVEHAPPQFRRSKSIILEIMQIRSEYRSGCKSWHSQLA
jgi:hypothetical protein